MVSFHERRQYPAKSVPRHQGHWSTSNHHASLSPQCEALATFRTDASEHVAALLTAEPRRRAEITHILENVCEMLCAAGMVPLTELCPPSASTPHGTCPCSLLARGEECDTWRKCTTTLTSHLHMLRWKPLFFFQIIQWACVSAMKPMVPEFPKDAQVSLQTALRSHPVDPSFEQFSLKGQSQDGWWPIASHLETFLKNPRGAPSLSSL